MKLLGGSDRKERENKRVKVEIPASNWNTSQVIEHNNEKITFLCLTFKMTSNVIPNLNKKQTWRQVSKEMTLFTSGSINLFLSLLLGGGCYLSVVETCTTCGLIHLIKENLHVEKNRKKLINLV